MGDSTFAASEVRRALSELSPWGFESASVVPTRPSQADLVLLDHTEITVECSELGWTVVVPAPSDAHDDVSRFPTLDDLLLSISPEFRQTHSDKLFAAIETVANERRST